MSSSQQGRKESVVAHLQKSISELKCVTTDVFSVIARISKYIYAAYSLCNIRDSPA